MLLQSQKSFTIFNREEKEIDFKFQFSKIENFEVTTSNGFIAYPRAENGIVVNIGDCDSLRHMTESKEQLKKKKVLTFRNMNDIKFMFK